MKVAWFHPFSGIAGDMALGSLVDAGADLGEVRTMLDGLGVRDWDVSAEPVLRAGIAGTKIHVRVQASSVVRTAASIDALVAAAPLPDRVRDRARLVFAALARAEGRLHRSEPAQVHFHEVGSTDAIIDVVGTCAALEVLGVERVASAPVVTGTGMVRAAHGIIPNPSPAVVELLAGAPTRGIGVPVELTTPTGAAILAALVDAWGPLPPLTITTQGFGAGATELDHRPNLTQVVVGDTEDAALVEGQPVVLLETNLDDVTGEVVAHALAALIEAGAHDAWVSPVLMKKGRPGHVVHALADVADAELLRRVLVAETGSLGVRGQRLERWPEVRTFRTVEAGIGSGTVKVSVHRAKAEFDDAVRLAEQRRLPLREVQAALEDAWRRNADADEAPHVHEHPHEHEHEHPHPHEHLHSDWSEEGPADPVA